MASKAQIKADKLRKTLNELNHAGNSMGDALDTLETLQQLGTGDSNLNDEVRAMASRLAVLALSLGQLEDEVREARAEAVEREEARLAYLERDDMPVRHHERTQEEVNAEWERDLRAANAELDRGPYPKYFK